MIQMVLIDKNGVVWARVSGFYTFHWKDEYHFCICRDYISFLRFTKEYAYIWDNYTTDDKLTSGEWVTHSGYGWEHKVFTSLDKQEFEYTEDLVSLVQDAVITRDISVYHTTMPNNLKPEFLNFMKDETRKQFLHLKEKAIKASVLVKGVKL